MSSKRWNTVRHIIKDVVIIFLLIVLYFNSSYYESYVMRTKGDEVISVDIVKGDIISYNAGHLFYVKNGGGDVIRINTYHENVEVFATEKDYKEFMDHEYYGYAEIVCNVLRKDDSNGYYKPASMITLTPSDEKDLVTYHIINPN